MAEATVSAGYVKSLMDFARSRGAEQSGLTAASGIEPEHLANPDTRIPFARFKALMRAAGELCGDPAFPLHFGAGSLFVEMSIVGLICHAAETMAEAFGQMNRYARLVVEVDGHETGDRFALEPDREGVWIVDRRRNPNDFPELTESTFARFIGDVYRYFGDIPFAKLVHVTHPAPAHRAEYDRVLKVPVVFDSDRNAMLIDPSWLSVRTHKPNRYVFGIFSEHAETLLKSLQNSKTIRGQVESMLIPMLHTGEVSMEQVARRMGLSRTSLYRRMKADGIGFDTLLDDLRHQMALHYLNGEKVSVNQTAYLVGFSDPSAFSRAFKRWTGSSPGQFKHDPNGKNGHLPADE